MLGEILPQRLGLFHHLLVNGRGVEQVQLAVLAPHREAEVGAVEALLVRHDAYQISVAHLWKGIAPQARIFLRYVVAERLAVLGLFKARDAVYPRGAAFEQRVFVGMEAHIINVRQELFRETLALSVHVGHQPVLHRAIRPPREVMQARDVAIGPSAAVAKEHQRAAIVFKASAARPLSGSKCEDGFGERGAVKFFQVDYQPLLLAPFQCGPNVGNAQKLAGIIEHFPTLRRIFRQKVHHPRGVGRRVNALFQNVPVLGRGGEGGEKSEKRENKSFAEHFY